MRIEDLVLTKEEIPILRKTSFIVPVYPRLLRKDLQIDPTIAQRTFAQAAEEWYRELHAHTLSMKDGEEKAWFMRVFLKQPPHVAYDKYSREQRMHPLTWASTANITNTGFTQGFSISRNAGGSLYLDEQEPDLIMPKLVNFSPEKFKTYALPETEYGPTFARTHVYQHHNIDNYPGALFLRNWALLTLNETILSVGDQLLKS